jgi:hypothetical protein
MKIIKASQIILIIIIISFTFFLIIGLFLPSKIEVERAIIIHAKPEIFRPLISEFRNWSKWNAWAEDDPDLVNQGENLEKKNGSTHILLVNEHLGIIRMTIIETDTQGSRLYNLSLEKKENIHKGFLIYQQTDSTMNVKLALEMVLGENIFSKYEGVMLKPYFERDFDVSLKHLKRLAESDTSLIESDDLIR